MLNRVMHGRQTRESVIRNRRAEEAERRTRAAAALQRRRQIAAAERGAVEKLRRDIVEDPMECIRRNNIWRGDLIPMIPIERNCMIVSDEKYDVDRLKTDVASAVSEAEAGETWVRKTNMWQSIALRTFDGKTGKDSAFLTSACLEEGQKERFRDTHILDACPYIKEIIGGLNTDVYLVRLLKLSAKGYHGFHHDGSVFNQRYTIIRLHLPIITNDKCKFLLGYPTMLPSPVEQAEGRGFRNVKRLYETHLTAGDMWFTNVTTLHAIENFSDEDRVHLVIDVKPTPEMFKKIYGSLTNYKP